MMLKLGRKEVGHTQEPVGVCQNMQGVNILLKLFIKNQKPSHCMPTLCKGGAACEAQPVPWHVHGEASKALKRDRLQKLPRGIFFIYIEPLSSAWILLCWKGILI